jgi:hypothetical protein
MTLGERRRWPMTSVSCAPCTNALTACHCSLPP